MEKTLMGHEITVCLRPKAADEYVARLEVDGVVYPYSVDLTDHCARPDNPPKVVVLSHVNRKLPNNHPERITYVKITKRAGYAIESIYRPDNLEVQELHIPLADDFLKNFNIFIPLPVALRSLLERNTADPVRIRHLADLNLSI